MTDSEHEDSKARFKAALQKKKNDSRSRNDESESNRSPVMRASSGKKRKMFRRKSG